MMSSPPPQEVATPEEFEFFIEELKKLIEEAPPGYQSKLARAIADLQQQKLVKLATLRDMLQRKLGEEFDYEFLLQSLLRGINDPASNTN